LPWAWAPSAPALAEGRAVAAALEAIARQPEAAGTISRTLFVGLAMIETMAIYCLVIALLLLFRQPVRAMTFDWTTFALQPSTSWSCSRSCGISCSAPSRRSSPGAAPTRRPHWRRQMPQSRSRSRDAQARAEAEASAAARAEVLRKPRRRQRRSVPVSSRRPGPRRRRSSRTVAGPATAMRRPTRRKLAQVRDLAAAVAARALAAQPASPEGYADRLITALQEMAQPDRAALLGGDGLSLVAPGDLPAPVLEKVQGAFPPIATAAVTQDPALIAGLELRSDSGRCATRSPMTSTRSARPCMMTARSPEAALDPLKSRIAGVGLEPPPKSAAP
jgi:F-type H+-transporting ATPase subunit c